MSNEPQAQGSKPALQVPDYLKAMGGQTKDADSLASASMSIPRISMRGKKFRFMEGGEEVHVVNDKIRVTILGVDPGPNLFIKTFYIDAYTGADNANPPDCSSDNGVRPSPWVSKPQHPTCMDCPKNRFGSAMSRKGKPAKACKDSKRLWVSRAEEADNPEAIVYALQVPVTSLKNLSEFGREMKNLNVPVAAAIAEITMDDDSEFPMITIQPVGFAPEETAKRLIERAEKKDWKFEAAPAPALPAGQPAAALPGQPTEGSAPAPAAAEGAAPTTVEAKPGNMNDVIGNW